MEYEEISTTSKDELCTTTTTGGREEEVLNTSVIATTDDDFTTSTSTTTTTMEEEDEKSNNYYDNIDTDILRTEYEDVIVFEDSLAPTTISTDNHNDIIIEVLLTTEKFDIIVCLLNEDTLDFVIGILLDNPLADHTREVICGILMEALSRQTMMSNFSVVNKTSIIISL